MVSHFFPTFFDHFFTHEQGQTIQDLRKQLHDWRAGLSGLSGSKKVSYLQLQSDLIYRF